MSIYRSWCLASTWYDLNMQLALIIWLVPTMLGVGVLLLAASTPGLWLRQKLLGEVSAGLLLTGLPFVAFLPLATPTVVFMAVVHLWLLLLAARLIFGRLDKPFLRSSTQLNAAIAGALISARLLITWFTENIWSPSGADWRLGAIACLAFAIAASFLWHVAWSLRHYRLKPAKLPGRMDDLPTVSVCIPARNEDHALTECIAAVLRSDYPKLEVLVLDDCSQDKTAQVIKSFAHDGVRFVQGDVPSAGWLGRNQAMQTLASHASGEYLMYIGVDTQLGPNTISELVASALNQKLEMLSVLPPNQLGVHLSTIMPTLQYFWRLVLPVNARHVPVSSKCFLITAKALKKLGSFESVKHSVVPESSFARRLHASNTYRFAISNSKLGMTVAKKWTSQLETSNRLLYPTLKRQPFYALLGVLLLATLITPFVMAPVNLIAGDLLMAVLNFLAGAMLVVVYGLVASKLYPQVWLLTTVLLPFALLQELLILLVSMVSYEFSEVNWKGRNVCYPVIQPVLPASFRSESTTQKSSHY